MNRSSRMEVDRGSGDGSRTSSTPQDVSPGDASSSFEKCTSTHTIECFSAVLHKCRAQYEWSRGLIEKVRARKQYPHTGFFQQHFGAPDQVNCRTRDLLQNVQSMNTAITPALMADIYQSNLRFQISIMNLMMTNRMLESSLKDFMDHVNTYESLVYQQYEQQQANQSSGVNETSTVETAVVSTTYTNDEPVSSSGLVIEEPSGSASSAGSALLQAIRTAGAQISRHMKLIPTMLNQIPLLASPLAVELRLMDIYDDYDDSPMMHRLLTDRELLSMVQPADLGVTAGGASRLPPLMHNWDKLLSQNVNVAQQRPTGTNNSTAAGSTAPRAQQSGAPSRESPAPSRSSQPQAAAPSAASSSYSSSNSSAARSRFFPRKR